MATTCDRKAPRQLLSRIVYVSGKSALNNNHQPIKTMSMFSPNLPITPPPFGQPFEFRPGLFDRPLPGSLTPRPFDDPRRFHFERSLEGSMPGHHLADLRRIQVNHLMCFGPGSQL